MMSITLKTDIFRKGELVLQKNILGAIFCRMKGEPFEVTYWDGKTEKYGSENN